MLDRLVLLHWHLRQFFQGAGLLDPRQVERSAKREGPHCLQCPVGLAFDQIATQLDRLVRLCLHRRLISALYLLWFNQLLLEFRL